MSKFWSSASPSSSSTRNDDDDDDEALWEEEQDEDSPPLGKDDMSSDPNLAWGVIKKDQVFEPPLSSTNSRSADCTRIVCISDTHGKHRDVQLPPGDILIHAGDFTKSGEVRSIADLCKFFGESNFLEVVCIAGNHDMTLQPEYYEENWKRFHNKQFDCEKARASLEHCVYLKDSWYVSKSGVEIYGSPWSPVYFDWSFNLERGEAIRKVWDEIPDSTDVLVTHGPPLGRGDYTSHNGRAGCYDLLVAVQEKSKPRVHIFGHIHEGAGTTFDGKTLFVNASNLDTRYQAVHFPVVVDLPHDPGSLAKVVPPEFKNIEGYEALSTREEVSTRCRELGFEALANFLEVTKTDLPVSGNGFFREDAYEKIVDSLGMHRDTMALKQLRKLLLIFYSQAFP